MIINFKHLLMNPFAWSCIMLLFAISSFVSSAKKAPYTTYQAIKMLNLTNNYQTKEEIKKAYRTLAMKWHPDRPGGNEEQFKKIANAYSSLHQDGVLQDYDPNQSSSYYDFSSDYNFFRDSFFSYRESPREKKRIEEVKKKLTALLNNQQEAYKEKLQKVQNELGKLSVTNHHLLKGQGQYRSATIEKTVLKHLNSIQASMSSIEKDYQAYLDCYHSYLKDIKNWNASKGKEMIEKSIKNPLFILDNQANNYLIPVAKKCQEKLDQLGTIASMVLDKQTTLDGNLVAIWREIKAVAVEEVLVVILEAYSKAFNVQDEYKWYRFHQSNVAYKSENDTVYASMFQELDWKKVEKAIESKRKSLELLGPQLPQLENALKEQVNQYSEEVTRIQNTILQLPLKDELIDVINQSMKEYSSSMSSDSKKNITDHLKGISETITAIQESIQDTPAVAYGQYFNDMSQSQEINQEILSKKVKEPLGITKKKSYYLKFIQEKFQEEIACLTKEKEKLLRKYTFQDEKQKEWLQTIWEEEVKIIADLLKKYHAALAETPSVDFTEAADGWHSCKRVLNRLADGFQSTHKEIVWKFNILSDSTKTYDEIRKLINQEKEKYEEERVWVEEVTAQLATSKDTLEKMKQNMLVPHQAEAYMLIDNVVNQITDMIKLTKKSAKETDGEYKSMTGFLMNWSLLKPVFIEKIKAPLPRFQRYRMVYDDYLLPSLASLDKIILFLQQQLDSLPMPSNVPIGIRQEWTKKLANEKNSFLAKIFEEYSNRIPNSMFFDIARFVNNDGDVSFLKEAADAINNKFKEVRDEIPQKISEIKKFLQSKGVSASLHQPVHSLEPNNDVVNSNVNIDDRNHGLDNESNKNPAEAIINELGLKLDQLNQELVNSLGQDIASYKEEVKMMRTTTTQLFVPNDFTHYIDERAKKYSSSNTKSYESEIKKELGNIKKSIAKIQEMAPIDYEIAYKKWLNEHIKAEEPITGTSEMVNAPFMILKRQNRSYLQPIQKEFRGVIKLLEEQRATLLNGNTFPAEQQDKWLAMVWEEESQLIQSLLKVYADILAETPSLDFTENAQNILLVSYQDIITGNVVGSSMSDLKNAHSEITQTFAQLSQVVKDYEEIKKVVDQAKESYLKEKEKVTAILVKLAITEGMLEKNQEPIDATSTLFRKQQRNNQNIKKSVEKVNGCIEKVKKVMQIGEEIYAKHPLLLKNWNIVKSSKILKLETPVKALKKMQEIGNDYLIPMQKAVEVAASSIIEKFNLLLIPNLNEADLAKIGAEKSQMLKKILDDYALKVGLGMLWYCRKRTLPTEVDFTKMRRRLDGAIKKLEKVPKELASRIEKLRARIKGLQSTGGDLAAPNPTESIINGSGLNAGERNNDVVNSGVTGRNEARNDLTNSSVDIPELGNLASSSANNTFEPRVGNSSSPTPELSNQLIDKPTTSTSSRLASDDGGGSASNRDKNNNKPGAIVVVLVLACIGVLGVFLYQLLPKKKPMRISLRERTT